MSNLPQLQHRATYQQMYLCANRDGVPFHTYLIIRTSYYSLSQEQGESEHITYTNHGGREHCSRVCWRVSDVSGAVECAEKA